MSALRWKKNKPTSTEGETVGVARVDARTKDLTKRLRPGDVAIIDHLDIDRVAAEALVASQPIAVINAARSTSGRYPNVGPGIITSAGIPLIDDCGPSVMSIHDGQSVRIDGGEIRVDDEAIATGVVQTPARIEQSMKDARAGLSIQLEAFAENTMDYLRRERDLLLDGVGVPKIHTSMEGRHVLIVVRGYNYKEDLVALKPYIREYHPIIIGVDGGADAVLEEGFKPDLIVGDMDSVSDAALSSGAEVIVHAYRDGRAPGLERVENLGVPHVVFPATGTSEDIAMLLADDKGAELIVALGTHATLVEFLDKGRAGMASTFLTRLRVGGRLVDAKGVSHLYRNRISNLQLAMLSIAGLLAVVVALSVTNAGQTFFSLLGARLDDLISFFTGLFSSKTPASSSLSLSLAQLFERPFS